MTSARIASRSWRDSLAYRLLFTPVGTLLRGRVAPLLDRRGTLDEAKLPDPLMQTVQTVLKRARLWPVERADVARELIAHFHDGLDSGATVEALNGSFGDPRHVARLISRAKRRQRPLWWRGLTRFGHGVLLLLGLMVVIYAVQAIRMATAKVQIRRHYVAEVNAAARAVPEDERAWPLYLAAELALTKRPYFELEYLRDLRPGTSTWDEWVAYARENQASIEQFRAATGRPHLAAPMGSQDEGLRRLEKMWMGNAYSEAAPRPDEDLLLPFTPIPQLGVLRDASRLLLIDTFLAAEDRDAEHALADLRAQFGVFAHAREAGWVYTDLVALGALANASHAIREVLVRRPEFLSDSMLFELAHRLSALGDAEALRVRFDGERAGFEDFLQHFYTDNGSGNGLPRPGLLQFVWSGAHYHNFGLARDIDHSGDNVGAGWPVPFVPNHRMSMLIMPLIAAGLGDRAEMRAGHAMLVDQYEAETRQPLWQRQESRAVRTHCELQGSMSLSPVAMFLPPLAGASLAGEYVVQERDATLVAIALELYHRQHGDWPATLAALTPELLPAVPMDRYDGQALKYVIRDGRPLVYSVGTDRDDDGGCLPIAGAKALWRCSPNRGARDWLAPGAGIYAPNGDWILWPMPEE